MWGLARLKNHKLRADYLLHCILGCPFSCRTIVPSPIGFQKLSDIRYQWIIGVGVGKKRTNRKQHLADRQGRTPLVLENVKADTSIRVDVTMIDTGSEVNLGWFEWIVGGEMNVQEEYAAGIGRVIWTHDRRLPMKHVITDWSCRTIGRRVLTQIDKFCYCNSRRQQSSVRDENKSRVLPHAKVSKRQKKHSGLKIFAAHRAEKTSC